MKKFPHWMVLLFFGAATLPQNSALSKAVNHPLPYPITVTKNGVTNVDMEVIDVNEREPEELGYASFFINAVNVLRLGVMIDQGNGVSLTAAKACIVEGTDTETLQPRIYH